MLCHVGGIEANRLKQLQDLEKAEAQKLPRENLLPR